ncbi:ATP-binding protein [Actinomadura sp. 3N508]|uniref:ATP-binding protein n=1 Tax=Actinomadura sp. 3N508 TaxID=3375153 RepID=UPI0037B9DE95
MNDPMDPPRARVAVPVAGAKAAGRPADIVAGGACAFQLSQDATCASRARSLLAATMRQLGFPEEPIEDAQLAVSELATNVHVHTVKSRGGAAGLPELWVWGRTWPASELVVSVFDVHRNAWPVDAGAELLDEHGKGLTIVAALTSATGAHITRSRVASAVLGKCVWFALPVSATWPARRPMAPGRAALWLVEALRARGVSVSWRSDHTGVSVINAEALNVWVEPKVFTWRDGADYVRRPLADLQETAERIVGHIETARAATFTA